MKKLKMTNGNPKKSNFENQIKLKFNIQWFLEEKHMFYHERQNPKYGK